MNKMKTYKVTFDVVGKSKSIWRRKKVLLNQTTIIEATSFKEARLKVREEHKYEISNIRVEEMLENERND